MQMKVLVACEFSGAVRDAFINKGHDAWSCDLEDVVAEGEYPGHHLYGNVLDFLDGNVFRWKWDLLIAHPPCTYLANSGVRWLKDNPVRWKQMEDACLFFTALLNADIPKVAVENPIMHCHAKARGIGQQTQTIQPWQFGHGETKATCLWLRNLPKLTPTNIVEGREARIHNMAPSEDRQKLRSITYKGIAEAMAEQWG